MFITAYSETILVENFYSALQSTTCLSPPAQNVPQKLFRLFAFYTLNRNAMDCNTLSFPAYYGLC